MPSTIILEDWLNVSINSILVDQTTDVASDVYEAINSIGELQYEVSGPASSWKSTTLIFCNNVSVHPPLEIRSWYSMDAAVVLIGLETLVLDRSMGGDQK